MSAEEEDLPLGRARMVQVHAQPSRQRSPFLVAVDAGRVTSARGSSGTASLLLVIRVAAKDLARADVDLGPELRGAKGPECNVYVQPPST